MHYLISARTLLSTQPSNKIKSSVHGASIASQLLTSDTALAKRSFAEVKDLDDCAREIYFSSNVPRWSSQGPGLHVDDNKPDPRTLQLGNTVRELHARLPTLLQSPLPSEILSPQITLHLFPSTHPHLPKVSGRIAYIAALWTAPVAWGQIPLIGNVKLNIISERMIKGTMNASSRGDEKLVVKWKTCAKGGHRDATGGKYRDTGIGGRDPVERIKAFLGRTSNSSTTQTMTAAATDGETRDGTADEEEFCGIFIFEFDAKGRIVKHVIEHTEHGEHWDKTNRVVSVTDWLLGKFNGASRNDIPALAYCDLHGRDDLRRTCPTRGDDSSG